MTRDRDGRNQRLALLGINAALLGVLGMVTFSANADAQQRSRGAYTMVSGGVPGSSAGAIFVVDTVNEELIALTYDGTTKKLQGVDYQNLRMDAAALVRSGR